MTVAQHRSLTAIWEELRREAAWRERFAAYGRLGAARTNAARSPSERREAARQAAHARWDRAAKQEG